MELMVVAVLIAMAIIKRQELHLTGYLLLNGRILMNLDGPVHVFVVSQICKSNCMKQAISLTFVMVFLHL